MNKIQELINHPEKYMIQAGGEYELISEMSFLRSRIQYTGEKIIIYGAGIKGEYLKWWLEMENISVEFFLDKDSSKNGTILRNTCVYSLDNVTRDCIDENMLALISVQSFEENSCDIIVTLCELGIKKFIYPFDKKYSLPDYRYMWRNYYLQKENELCELYDSLGDGESQDVMFEFIKMNITNCAYKGIHNKTAKKYFECYRPLEKEVFLNIGGYVGDNVFAFLENRDEVFEKVMVVESDSNAFVRLINNLGLLPEGLRKKIEVLNIFMDEKIGARFDNDKITLISMDIEGNELEALKGLSKSINNNRPVLAISAYHKPEDLMTISEIIKGIGNYEIYLRKYAPSYNSHLRSGELVLYGIPMERTIN